jgi:predicted MFS family arabinose efflux permease
MQTKKSATSIEKFTPYQKFVVIMLAFLQFTIVLDFMILSPLGAMLIPALKITPAQFGLVVSAYAFSAGASGLLTAGFADRFDRKKLLLFFYTGFILGTLFCGLAPNYYALLIARMVTGIFGGVIGSIVFAITTDLFPLSMRGRVMGVVQTSLAASQVLGIPLGLYFANLWGWHAPFIMIVLVGAIAGFIIFLKLNSITEHLKHKTEKSPFRHLVHTVSKPRYLQGFAATALLSTGGFMIMPFSSAFIVHNVGISMEKLPMIYVVTGLCSIIMGPLIGKASDTIGKFPIFLIGTILTLISIFIYTRMGISSIEFVMFINVVLFAGITSRIIASGALTSAIPISSDRGAYMSVSASLQQISGGLAAALAGLIVSEGPGGMIMHFDQLGFVVIASGVVTLGMMYFINEYVKGKSQSSTNPMPAGHD